MVVPRFTTRAVAEETGLKLALSDTLKTGFLATRPKLIWSALEEKQMNFKDFLDKI